MKVKLPIIAVLLISGCAGTQTVNDGSMYPRGTPTGVLHIKATWTEHWCGGAEPDPKEWPRTTPWSGSMYVRAARPDSTGRLALNDLRAPILDTIATNNEGHGWLRLPAGTYLILDADRVDRRKHDELMRRHAKPALHTEPIDAACMHQWLYGPFPAHTITSGDTLHVELPLQSQCPWYSIPCVAYNGPLPP